MKLKLTLIIAFSLFTTLVIAQDKKGTLVGVHFTMSDFKSVKSFDQPSTGKGYSTVRDMAKGISFSYWKGLTSKIDYAVKFNAVQYDYALINQGISGKKEIGLELEPNINVHIFPEGARISPFLTTGAGVGLYNNKIGGFIPAGGGFEFNFQKIAYLFVQAQYKFTLTKNVLGDNLFYSIGFAQRI